jgi:hypothetical protein
MASIVFEHGFDSDLPTHNVHPSAEHSATTIPGLKQLYRRHSMMFENLMRSVAAFT